MESKDKRLTAYSGGNLGMNLDLSDSLIVPNELFFVRNNGPVPSISRQDWRLQISGEVANPITINFDQLAALPQRRVASVIECAGNGRTGFSPATDGTPWQQDAAGNAVWTGPSLADVLSLAQPLESAVDVVAWGADLEDMGRALPIHVANRPEVLLVTEMNGEPLPAAHGHPVRLLVPGWAGIAQTKWATRLELLAKPFIGHYQTTMYMIYDETETPLRPVREMPVKSLIASPVADSELKSGEILIEGFAWSGYAAIERVDCSVDGGETWDSAEIVERDGPWAWLRWQYRWTARPGDHLLCSRATDERANVQPVQAQWNARGYQNNSIPRIPVAVH